MKKLLILFIISLLILSGCTSSPKNELTIEEVQMLARQTIDARNETTPTVSSGLVIRPVQATAQSDTQSFAQPVTEQDPVISRPVYNTATPVPTAVQFPTAIYAQPVQTVCERMRFIDDVTIPDNTLLQPGQNFRKTWRIQNAGSCTWTAGYQLVWSGGDRMGQTFAVNIPRTVAAGETVDISVDLVAPLTSGTYQSDWKMRSPSGNLFGTANAENSAIWTKIIVGTSANISTIAPGVTPVNSGCQIISVEPAYKSVLPVGAETDFYIKVMNTGNETWTSSDYDVAFIGGENMLKRPEQTRKDMPFDVAPGQTLYFGIDAVTPNRQGTYTMTMGIVRNYEVLCSMDVTIQALD